MAVVMRMEWPGVTPDQYEEARRQVGWEREVPDGGVFHIAFFSGGSLHVVDIWESAEQFERFGRERLRPVTDELGLAGEPRVTIDEVHAVFDPATRTARA